VLLVFVVGVVVLFVTGGVMVVFSVVVCDMVMLVTGVTGGVMVMSVFVIGDVVMLVTDVKDGVMVVASFVVNNVLMFMMGEVKSPYIHICEARKNMQATKQ
jgi:hypothetical protein